MWDKCWCLLLGSLQRRGLEGHPMMSRYCQECPIFKASLGTSDLSEKRDLSAFWASLRAWDLFKATWIERQKKTKTTKQVNAIWLQLAIKLLVSLRNWNWMKLVWEGWWMKFVSNWMNLWIYHCYIDLYWFIFLWPIQGFKLCMWHCHALPSYLSNGPNTQLIGCFGLLDASSSASLAFRFRPRLWALWFRSRSANERFEAWGPVFDK